MNWSFRLTSDEELGLWDLVYTAGEYQEGGGDLLVSLQGSPGAKVENSGFECWTSFSVERAQLPVQETETKMGDRERCNEGGGL